MLFADTPPPRHGRRTKAAREPRPWHPASAGLAFSFCARCTGVAGWSVYWDRCEVTVHEALERVYSEHRQGLYTLALSIARDGSLAEEAVHEAFVRLCSRRLDARRLTAYVYQAVRNAAVDQVRRQSARRRLDGSIYNGWMPPGAADDPADDAGRVEQLAALRRAVDALGQADREAVVMRIYGQLSFPQIADVTGESVNTVASRYRRALAKLREQMQ